MRPMLAWLSLFALISATMIPPAYAVPARMAAKQKACKAAAIASVRRTMGAAARTNNPAAKAKGMTYYKQCMAR